MSSADSDNKGVPIFNAFDLTDVNAQLYLSNICDELLNRTDVRSGDTYSRCVMSEFRTWSVTNGYSFPATSSNGLGLVAMMILFLRTHTNIYGDDVGFALKSTANTHANHHQTVHFSQDDAHATATDTASPHRTWKHNEIDFSSSDSYRISFHRATVLTYIDREQGGLSMKPSYDTWQEWMDRVNAFAPTSLGDGFQASSQWSRMRVELAFISGTIKSIAISVVTVALTILLFTHNLWLMMYTIICIMMIVVCLLGLFVIFGFSLGAMEAISVPLVVGLSVDYMLHLAHAYNHAGEIDKSDPTHQPVSDRIARMKSALLTIGPSVVSAAVTTCGSMLVLIFCQIHLFKEIGIIVSSTLLLGIYFSMCVFAVLCLIAGPEKQQGNIVVWAQQCKRRFCHTQQQRVTEDEHAQLDVSHHDTSIKHMNATIDHDDESSDMMYMHAK